MTEQIPTIAYWKGKPLEQCDREELIECIKYLSRQVEAEAEKHNQTLRLWESFEKGRCKMTDQPPPIHDPIQKWRRCNEGHDLFQLWIRAFLDGHPDTKYLWDQYKAHLDGCDTCKLADRPR